MEITLGIDVSKKTFDVAIILPERPAIRRKLQNKLSGFMELNQLIQAQNASGVMLALEATGTYGDSLATFAFHSGWTVFMINPARIKAFATALGQRNKTDRADCLTIALFVQKTPDLLPWVPLSSSKAELREYVRERLYVQKQLQAEQTRHLTVGKSAQTLIQKRLELLKTQIKELTQAIAKVIQQDELLARGQKLLTSIPGIGSWTAAFLLSELPPIDKKTKAREIASLFGLCPRIVQSGTSVRGRGALNGQGRRSMSHQLYMPALVAIKRNPLIQHWAEGLRQRGKRPKQIIAAAIHRLLRLAVGVLKSQTEFNPKQSRP